MNKQFEKNSPEDVSGTVTDFTAAAKLYAARTRLCGAFDQMDMRNAIYEIVANLIGSEELGLYGFMQKGEVPRAQWLHGVDVHKYSLLTFIPQDALSVTLKDSVALCGIHSNFVSDDKDVTAIIPLSIDEKVRGFLVIFRLLPQKREYDSTDEGLCKLISEFGGSALSNMNH